MWVWLCVGRCYATASHNSEQHFPGLKYYILGETHRNVGLFSSDKDPFSVFIINEVGRYVLSMAFPEVISAPFDNHWNTSLIENNKIRLYYSLLLSCYSSTYANDQVCIHDVKYVYIIHIGILITV